MGSGSWLLWCSLCAAGGRGREEKRRRHFVAAKKQGAERVERRAPPPAGLPEENPREARRHESDLKLPK